MRFSEREGFKPIRVEIQRESVDEPLRIGLWNVLTVAFWENRNIVDSVHTLCRRLWMHYFDKPVDSLSSHVPAVVEGLREYFFNCKWYEVYDFIEFVANKYPDRHRDRNTQFMQACNMVLEKHLSAYRFVNGQITGITSEEEISEIEEAISGESSLTPHSAHLEKALDHLSDRKSPDYANSIKESISAVEAVCNLIAGKSKATLSQALKEIEKTDMVQLHPALKRAFDSMYGYTSDEGGIRHAMLKESALDFEDAKFMLVSCSAFVNYLKEKAAKAGIEL